MGNSWRKRPRARGQAYASGWANHTRASGGLASRTAILQNEANFPEAIGTLGAGFGDPGELHMHRRSIALENGAGCGLLFVAATRRLVRQVRFQELREGIPRSVVSALLVAVGAELGEAMRRPGIDLDFVRHACALQLA